MDRHFLFLSGKWLRKEFLGYRVDILKISKWWYHFNLPVAVYMCRFWLFPLSLVFFVLSAFYLFSRWVVVVAHCSFNLHLLGNWGNRALFSCFHWLSSFVKCVCVFKAILFKVRQYICVFLFKYFELWKLRISLNIRCIWWCFCVKTILDILL